MLVASAVVQFGGPLSTQYRRDRWLSSVVPSFPLYNEIKASAPALATSSPVEYSELNPLHVPHFDLLGIGLWTKE